MYDGNAWPHADPMLVATAGFLVMAIAVPDAFGSGGWPFAPAYLVVVLVHGWSFARSSMAGSVPANRRAPPGNLTVACATVRGWAIQ
jgi:low temperature requirement protein LtrA